MGGGCNEVWMGALPEFSRRMSGNSCHLVVRQQHVTVTQQYGVQRLMGCISSVATASVTSLGSCQKSWAAMMFDPLDSRFVSF